MFFCFRKDSSFIRQQDETLYAGAKNYHIDLTAKAKCQYFKWRTG